VPLGDATDCRQQLNELSKIKVVPLLQYFLFCDPPSD
jgi:hypothetical protein